jgi:RHS repeat-associated protein
MNGSAVSYAYWPTPGGATLLQGHGGSGYSYYFQHKDWLGSARISSNLGPAIIDDRAFAPYGEMYDNFGSTSANENIFTGDTQDIVATGDCCFDTPHRELSANQGRWISPDPAGAGWNLYGYTANPNTNTDPTGLYIDSPGNRAACGGMLNFNLCLTPFESAGWLSGGLDEFDWTALGLGAPTPYGELSYNPIAFEFKGTLYGQSYDMTFSTVEDYASWRTAIAALPESQAYDVFAVICKNQGCDPDVVFRITYRFAYLVPNVTLDCDKGAGCTVAQDNLDGFWKDPLTFLHQGQSSWYSGFFFETPHLIDSDPISAHIDPFGPLNPLHYLLQMPAMIPDMISPPDTTYMNCSLNGGCFAQ